MTGSESRQWRGAFVAIETDSESRGQLQVLTTEAMRWKERIWIMDVSPFLNYWHRLVARSHGTLTGLWRQVLNQTFGTLADPSSDRVISFVANYRAACARNPWRALLLLYGMKEKDVCGLVGEASRFGRTLLRDLSWESWWQAVADAEEHLSRLQFRQFGRSAFRRQNRRLRLAAERLGFKRPQDMKILDYGGIESRYGTTLADLWRLLHDGDDTEGQAPHQMGFPWESWKFRLPPSVKRHMDYPLSLWDRIRPLLRDDMDRLCLRIACDDERVTEIDWYLTLEDMNMPAVPIRFKNPHDLKSERGKHTTALLQAEYAFERDRKARCAQMVQDEAVDFVPGIVSWKLCVVGSITVPPVVRDLFGELCQTASEEETLSRLENELPVPLRKFGPCGDWLPEDSYAVQGLCGSDPASSNEMATLSLDAAAKKRPLYIRRSPLPLPSIGRFDAGEFLESTMDKWWKEEDGNLERDYYRYVDPEGNSGWIFRDSSGKWYQHGIFG